MELNGQLVLYSYKKVNDLRTSNILEWYYNNKWNQNCTDCTGL